MKGVDRRGMSRVEHGGGHSTIVWGDDWNEKKIERKWGHGLKWPKLHGKTQEPAESRRSRCDDDDNDDGDDDDDDDDDNNNNGGGSSSGGSGGNEGNGGDSNGGGHQQQSTIS